MDYRRHYKQRYDIEFGSDYDIHHIDMNHENNDITNLILLPKVLHQKLHKTFRECPIKGTDVFTFEYCSNQLICGVLADNLQAAAEVYEECQYWASCKEMEELAIAAGEEPKFFTYNQFRK